MKGGVSWLVILSIFVFEIIAFGLALGAMSKRSEPTLVKTTVSQYCVYPNDIATGMSVGALLFLIVGQVILMAVTKCFCCGRSSFKSGGARIGAVITFSAAWFTFIIAELCLVVAARLNTVHTDSIIDYMDASDPNNITCKHVRKSLFAAGATFTFLTLVVSELYYVLYMKCNEGSWQDSAYKTGAPTISMTSYP